MNDQQSPWFPQQQEPTQDWNQNYASSGELPPQSQARQQSSTLSSPYRQQPYSPPQQQEYAGPISQPLYRHIPNKPQKGAFFKKKITIPLWLLILLIFLGVGGLVNTAASYSGTSANNNSASTDTNNSASNNTTASQNQPTTQPTVAPTLVPSPTPSPTPTQPPKWTTVQTFTGNGSKKTAVFTTPDDWKIIWSCNPSSSFGGEYNVIVDVDNPDGSSLDPGAVNTICQSGNTSDNTEEHQGGDVYLDINSEGAWKIQVQVLQ